MVTWSHSGSLLEHPLSGLLGSLLEIFISAVSNASVELLLMFFFPVHFTFFLAPGKGKLFKASKILHSEKISSGRKRSGSYDEMFESLARSLSHFVASLYKNRDLWAKKSGWELAPVIVIT